MKIESISLKSSTIIIFSIIGLIAIFLSLIASTYFKQSALDAQRNSLSRVIEVASQETLKQIKNQTFDLGMKLGHSRELISATKYSIASGKKKDLVQLLDDPFINGFVGFSKIDLRKLRIYNLKLELISESSRGTAGLEGKLTDYITSITTNRSKNDRLKAIDALWMSPKGLLFSTLVPLGGMRPVGYLEIIVDPVFNFSNIGNITKTPVRIYTMLGEQVNKDEQLITDDFLPIEFTLHTSDKKPSLKIVGYENIDNLNKEMEHTQFVTVSSFCYYHSSPYYSRYGYLIDSCLCLLVG